MFILLHFFYSTQSLLCVFICINRFDLLFDRKPHTSQACFRSSLCVSMWFLKVFMMANRFLQLGQENGRSPVWVRTCSVRSCLQNGENILSMCPTCLIQDVNTYFERCSFPHKLHLSSEEAGIGAWVFWCLAKLDRPFKHFPHILHWIRLAVWVSWCS